MGEPLHRLLVLPSFSFRLTLPSTHFFTSRIYFSFLSSLLSSLPCPPIASIPRRLFPSFPSFHSPFSLLPKIITDVGLALFHLGIVFSLFTFLFTISSASSSESDPLLYIRFQIEEKKENAHGTMTISRLSDCMLMIEFHFSLLFFFQLSVSFRLNI